MHIKVTFLKVKFQYMLNSVGKPQNKKKMTYFILLNDVSMVAMNVSAHFWVYTVSIDQTFDPL